MLRILFGIFTRILVSKCRFIAAIVLMVAATSLRAENAGDLDTDGDSGEFGDLKRAFSEGKPYVSARYRFESVDQDGFEKNAHASTLQTRVGYESAAYHTVRFNIEFEDVSPIGNELYNSTVNGKEDRPVVADPNSTELNQLFVTFNPIPKNTIRFGREALKLDNVRFVGDVGWRQNNQTFDGGNLTISADPDTRLFYGFVDNVNRIFGDDSPVGDFETAIHLFNARYSGLPIGNLTGYAYLFDVEDTPTISTWNLGGRFEGESSIRTDLGLVYDFEIAHQEDYADNPNSFSAVYWRSGLGLKMLGLTAQGIFESLGSDEGGIAFGTPFATLHQWNGWADKFLTTPEAGLNDASGSIAYKIAEISRHIQTASAEIVYHYFTSDYGSTEYGTEWDFNIAADFLSHFSIMAKYADYNSAEFATDTRKLIFTLSARFGL